MCRERWASERGAALPFALVAMIIMLGVSVVMVARSQAESQTTGRAANYETAVHAAEAGTDRVIEHINADITGTWTSDADGLSYTLSSTVTDERQWAVDRFEAALAAGSTELVNTPEGVALGIRPTDDAGDPMDVIFGVSRIGGDANPANRTRVVKLRFDRGYYDGVFALCTNGLLTGGGTVGIDGLAGNVHSNTGVDLSGGSGTISGALTSATSVYNPGGWSVGPGSGPDAPYQECPSIQARQLYAMRASEEFNLDDADADGIPDDWYDLCPDASVRRPPATGDTPCTGTVEAADAASTAYRGWRLQAGEWKLTVSANYPDDKSFPGVYYAYQRNVSIMPSSAVGRYTIMSESAALCTAGNSSSGSIHMAGNAKLSPFITNLLFAADTDIDFAGTSGAELNGFVGAHEQIDAGGTFSLNGSLNAEDACSPSGTPVTQTNVSGTVDLTFDADMSVPLPDVVRITAWNEL